MKIDALRFRVALDTPLDFGTMTISQRSYTRVRVALGDGRTGEATAIDRGIDVASIITELVAPGYRDEDSTTEALWEGALRSASPALSSGAGLRALSLVDVALAEARGELSAGVNDLSASATTIPAWRIVGYPPSSGPDVVEKEVVRAIDLGASGVKLPISADLERTRDRLSAALGAAEAVPVALDCAWSFGDANDVAELVRGYDLAWIEDPFPPGNLGELRRLKTKVELPIAHGDEDSNLYHPLHLLAAEAVDIVRLDVFAHGGWTHMQKLAAQLAEQPVSWHMSSGVHARVASLLPLNTISVERSFGGAGVDPVDEASDG